MASQKVDLYVDQGSDYYQSVYLQDQNGFAIDLTDYTFIGQIKEIPSGVTIASFIPTTTSASGGLMTLFLPASVTAQIPVTTPFNFYRYDIFMKNYTTGSTFMLFHGDIFANDQITQFS
jgi:hypothetical protein